VEAGTAAREGRIARPEILLHGLRPQQRGWLRWLTTTDHKRIGILYLCATFLFFILGGVEALIMRLQLAQPDNTLVSPETYNGLVTMHGTTMVFLFLVPVLAGFGNYMVPLMIGARDMARSGSSSSAESRSTRASSSSRRRPAGRCTRHSRTTPSRRVAGWMPGSS
jgi:hypothetical protein